MITFEEYKKKAQQIYNEGKEGKSCPDDTKLESWFESYKKGLEESMSLSKNNKNGVNSKPQRLKDNSPDFVREENSTEEDSIEEAGNLSLANKKGTNSKPKSIRDKKKISEAQFNEYVLSKISKLERLSEIAALKKKRLTENNPNAPWNQEEKESVGGKLSQLKLSIDGGDPDFEFIAKDQMDRWYLISRENLTSNEDEYKDIAFDYGNTPYDTERGEDGIDHNYEESTLDTEALLNAAGDSIVRGDVGTREEYAAGKHFVYLLNQEVAEELWSNGSELEKHPAVQALIDYELLKQKYPHAFTGTN